MDQVHGNIYVKVCFKFRLVKDYQEVIVVYITDQIFNVILQKHDLVINRMVTLIHTGPYSSNCSNISVKN